MHTVYGERSLFLTRLLVYIMNFRELFLITTLRSPGMHVLHHLFYKKIFFFNIFKKNNTSYHS